MTELIATLLGYLASLLLAISLLINNDLKFRWLNTFGCLSFIAYGILIHALPIIITNAILLLINLFYLVKIYRTQENFDLIEFKGGEKLVHKFLSFYAGDIRAYFPAYMHDESEGPIRFVVLRDLVIANIFVALPGKDGSAEILLNYTVAKYRDYKVGRFIFNRENDFLISRDIRQLVYKEVQNKQHEKFIRVMGFKKEDINGTSCYVKHL